ncbi:MAG: SUMF1/EgtB/PvdO family nonheme iron enzyme, partial [Planctomycetota bacterium]
MKPADEIRQLFKNAELGIDPNADEKVFEDVSGAHKETTESSPAMPEIWRIIMRSRKAQFTAAVVAVLAVYLCLQIPKNLVAPVYALQDTIEAYNSIRYLHVKGFCTVYGQRWDEESWIEFDEQGKPRRFRYETNRVSTGDEIGPVTIVSDGDGSYTWLPKLNLGFKRSGDSVYGSSLVQWEVSNAAPKLVFEKLQKQARDGEIILDVNEPERKNEPIVLVVTYPAESRSANWKKVLYIDQATRLVKKEEVFEKRDGQFQHERTIEFFDYDQQINPEMFSLEGELPETVFTIDQSGKEVGLAQGDMTDEEIAEEVTLQFLNAANAGDFNKVGQLYLGVPGFLIEKLSGGGGGDESKITSVGPVHPDPDPDSNIMVCPCKALGEVGGQNYEFDMKIHVQPVSGQPGRWMICGTTSHVKPAPAAPKPLEMVSILPGTFMMGSPSDEQDRDPDEGPHNQVTLTKGFYMGKYEVTVGQYVKFLEAKGKESGVNWDDNGCPLSRHDGSYTLRDDRSWNEPMAEV